MNEHVINILNFNHLDESEPYAYIGDSNSRYMIKNILKSKNIFCEWEDHILYQCLKTGELYSRQIDDFKNNFLKVVEHVN